MKYSAKLGQVAEKKLTVPLSPKLQTHERAAFKEESAYAGTEQSDWGIGHLLKNKDTDIHSEKAQIHKSRNRHSWSETFNCNLDNSIFFL